MDIDLTEAVTAAARRARQDAVDKYAKLYPDTHPMESFDELHILEQNHYREQVLPLIYAAHVDIARQAAAQALQWEVENLTAAVERKQASDNPNPLSWQTGALWARDRLRAAADVTATRP